MSMLPAGISLSPGAMTPSTAKQVSALVDMPDELMDLLFRFLHQNDGVLSKRARGSGSSRR